ncbi:glycosyltransferase family 2 protein [Lysobacter sp. FW306-1B-D06B]|uniref:glycosyltransferase family 2 protein n=1 Tax=Lysobacter sp. FW306-1B-D06B TaxID=3140250 RepID=UPI003140301C
MQSPSLAGNPTPTVSVVSPVYGCRGCLEELVDSVAAQLRGTVDDFEVILVDDASPDQAWSRIQELATTRPWLRGLRLARNFGQHSAISAGIEHATGEWVVVMDCDLQDPPAAIPDLYRKATSENFDVVFVQRQNRKDSWSKRLSSWGFFRLLTWLTGSQQDASTANFGIFRRPVIDAVCRMPERDRSFPLMVKWAGFRHGLLPVEHAPRAEGRSTYTLRKLLRLATNITLGYSEKPLKLVAFAGILCSLVSFFMVALAVARWIDGDMAVAGYTSVIASIWLVGGMLLFSLGVVGLYVGQVFRNVQGRPYYILAEDTRR